MRSDAPSGVMAAVIEALSAHVGVITARAVVQVALRHCGITPGQLEGSGLTPDLLAWIERRLSTYLRNDANRAACGLLLRGMVRGGARADARPLGPVRVAIENEQDIVEARTQVRDLASRMGFSLVDQIKIATAVSEVSRNIFKYAARGELIAEAVDGGRRGVTIRAVDRGPGIGNLDEVLSGTYRSTTGMGLGLCGCRKLMNHFEVTTSAGAGTTVTMARWV